MDESAKLLSKLTGYLKYQRYSPTLGRKETWTETIARNKGMHLKKYASVIHRHPKLKQDIDQAYRMVSDFKILPSMRSMQFAGDAIERNTARMYNCAYLPIKDIHSFGETLYLLLCGAGVGYSVQSHHIAQLPTIHKSSRRKVHTIEDSIEGWADAVKFLMASYMDTNPNVRCTPVFDGSKIRPKGAMINSINVRAPGPYPLLSSLYQARTILEQKEDGATLTSIEVMDIINILAKCALAGGIRRSAMICLFSPDDQEMLHAKDASSGWWVSSPWRAYSNNSAVILRSDPLAKQHFDRVWSVLSEGRSGEPGIFFTDDPTREILTNPCVEISLNPYQFCNLTEVNAATITSQQDFNERARAAALLGTLQAGYTSFKYIRDDWRQTTERESLLGVGLTGIANGSIYHLDETQAARCAVRENVRVSHMIGINRAHRVTTVKPSGSTSLLFGCASGIHALHSPYYIRRIRISKSDDLYGTLKKQIPELVCDDITDVEHSAIVSIPVCATGVWANYRREPVFTFLERIQRYQRQWIDAGHFLGINRHNVSATASLRPSDWDEVGPWLWRERHTFSCISIFPMAESDAIYKQTPFEECDKRTYKTMAALVKHIDLDGIGHSRNQSNDGMVPAACSGGMCDTGL